MPELRAPKAFRHLPVSARSPALVRKWRRWRDLVYIRRRGGGIMRGVEKNGADVRGIFGCTTFLQFST